MEPWLRICRPGPSRLLLFALVLVPPLHSAPAGGQAVKALRSIGFPDVATTAIGETDALGAVEPSAGFATVEPVRFLSPSETADAVANPPTVTRTSHAYLPLNGALPLRFAAARGWPAPLPAEEINVISDTTAAVDVSGKLAAASLKEKSEDTSFPEQADTQSPRNSDPSAVLTANMVLGYMGDLLGETAGLNARFLPAIPRNARAATTIAALRP